MQLIRVWLVGACVIGAATGCKRPGSDAAALKDVNALVEGRDDREQGAAGARIRCAPGSSETPFAARERVADRLPPRLKAEFAPAATKINLEGDRDKLHERCTSAVRDQVREIGHADEIAKAKFVACWTVYKDPSCTKDCGPGEPRIHILDDVDAVHANLIPMAVYAYSEYLVDGVIVPQMKTLAAESAERKFGDLFLSQRKKLAVAFIKLLSTMDKKDVLTRYRTRFDAKDDSDLAEQTLFQNFVLAETAESAYCSDASRAELDDPKVAELRNEFAAFDALFRTVASNSP